MDSSFTIIYLTLSSKVTTDSYFSCLCPTQYLILFILLHSTQIFSLGYFPSYQEVQFLITHQLYRHLYHSCEVYITKYMYVNTEKWVRDRYVAQLQGALVRLRKCEACVARVVNALTDGSKRMNKEWVLEFISLVIFSTTEIIVFVVNGLANPFRRAAINVSNVTEEPSRRYDTEVSIFIIKF